ncbi:MAG: hypothetical protein ACJ708_11010 [Nitrososphaeraceae archaeon]
MEHLSSELRDGTATSTMEKRQCTRALQQRIQPKRDIADLTSWTGYSE